MYVGVDIGGTKTLLAALNNRGEIVEESKFPTPVRYANFLLEVRHALAHFKHQEFRAGGVGMPVVTFDRQSGVAHAFGNQSWHNVRAQHDLERIFNCPIVAENDAKLAGLSEAMLLKDEFDKVLYVTVSTGIGYALVDHLQIDLEIGDGGGRAMVLEHRGQHLPWEDFAGGRAIVQRYGKKAMDITDAASWQTISRDLAKGLIELIAVTEPEVIVFGGSVGVYFDRFAEPLAAALKDYELPLIKLPALRRAGRPEQAVVFGCYDIARQRFAHESITH